MTSHSLQILVSKAIRGDRPAHCRSHCNYVAHVHEGTGDPPRSAETWRTRETLTERPEMKYAMSRQRTRQVGLATDGARRTPATKIIRNKRERERERERLNFLKEQNLVLTPHGVSPLWPLTLSHTLQRKTLDKIQEARLPEDFEK